MLAKNALAMLGAFARPFSAIAGTILATLLILSGPYFYWYDRTPTAKPLVHWHFGPIHLTWPDNPSARYSVLLASVKAAAVHVKVVQAKQTTVTAEVQQKAVAAKALIIFRTNTVLKEVHDALKADPGIDRRFRVPDLWVRSYNVSLGDDPAAQSPPSADGADSGLPISEATETAVANNGLCLLWRNRALQLSDWYAQQQAVTK